MIELDKKRSISKVSPSDDAAELDQQDSSRVVSIAEGEIPLLEKKGLQQFLLRDYPFPRLPAHCLRDAGKAQSELGGILLDMLKYLGLPPYVTLRVEEIEEPERAEQKTTAWKAGEFVNSPRLKEIRLRIRPQDTSDNVLAALCHECTHYFMTYHDLNWQDKSLNEVRTDVTANLIGFCRILEKGYKSMVTTEETQNTYVTRTQRLGYITEEDCRQIGEFLYHYREACKVSRYKKRFLDEEKKQLDVTLQTAQELALQLKNLDIGANRAVDAERLSVLRSALMEQESRDFAREIHVLKTEIETCQTLQKLEKCRQRAENLCCDILRLISVFQS